MTHCSDDDLLLEYYDESPRSGAHLRGCQECSARYGELKTLLDEVRLDPPERGDHYGLEVWQSIRHRLPPPQRSWRDLFATRWGFAAAALAWPAGACADQLLLTPEQTEGPFYPDWESRPSSVTSETRFGQSLMRGRRGLGPTIRTASSRPRSSNCWVTPTANGTHGVPEAMPRLTS